MRFRECKPEDLERARGAVAQWRREHPEGTAEQMLADIGHQFHRDYAPVLRAVLFRVDSRPPSIPAGITAITGEDR